MRLAAGFHLEPDGLELTEPAVVEFTLPVTEGAMVAYSAVSLSDDGTVDHGPSDGLRFDVLDDDNMRLTLQLAHFSDLIVVETDEEEIEVRRTPLALEYTVGGGPVVTPIVLVALDTEFEVRRIEFRWLRQSGMAESVTVTRRGFSGDWTLVTQWDWRGPISSTDFNVMESTARVGQTLTGRKDFSCDAVGDFAIRAHLLAEFDSRIAFIERTAMSADGERTRHVLDDSGGETSESFASTFAKFASTCVADVTATASPVTSPPTATVTAQPTVTVTAEPTVTVTAEPTVTVTAEPTETATPELDEVDELLRKIDEDLSMSATFSNGSCSRYPAGFVQPITIEFTEPNIVTLRQGTHVNTGPVNFGSGFAQLVEPGIEIYEIVFTTPDGATLRFSGMYFFEDGQGECTWSVAGTES